MSTGTARRKLLVILAEDNDDHALLIEMALERASQGPAEILRARNGQEALELVSLHRPDLLLLDLKMPGKSGHEVLAQIKADEALRRTPVAVLTSSDRDEDVARSYGLGSNHFLTKPEDPAVLEARLRSLLRNLPELGRIRRGAGEVKPSGESALGPESFLLRRLGTVVAILAIMGILLAFGYCTGALS